MTNCAGYMRSPTQANHTSILGKQKDASPPRQIQHSALCGFDSADYLFHPLLRNKSRNYVLNQNEDLTMSDAKV